MLEDFKHFMRCSSKILTSSSATLEETCSGRGECYNGTCQCKIQYIGEVCSGFNIPYYAGISSVFYLVALVSFIQLLICCITEYTKLKHPTVLKSCRLTTQKLLYFVVFLASTLRGAYFTKPLELQPKWATMLMSAYYPLLMTCSSLVVCYWAEVFHLRDIRWEKRHFLSKSFIGFLAFNIFLYSLFGAEVFSSVIEPKTNAYSHIFSGCYAALLLFVVIFFLIYGIEVFFKMRGAFIPDQQNAMLEPNSSQIHQSRFGLIFQAIMMIIIVGFLVSETLGDFWKSKVPMNSRNLHDVIFRVVEIAVALWFPCCLWNSMAPEKLWLLNPTKLITKNIGENDDLTGASANKAEMAQEEGQSFISTKDCWICYDSDNGDLIQPCNCTGDVSSVHHECLRKWLMESYSNSKDVLACKVCKCPYNITRKKRLEWNKGFNIQHWSKTIILFTIMSTAGGCTWMVIHLFHDPIVRVLTVGIAVLIGYVCIKCLGENTVVAYEKAKVGSIKIITNEENDQKI